MVAAAPGSLIDGRFRVERMLGSGGFGTVYKADDVGLKRTVAVKILDRTARTDEVSIARFEREAKALSLLQHKNVVGVFSIGIDSTGRPFIVMPYCEGQTLADIIHSQKRLPWQQAAAFIQQACIGLAAAHSAGIVHRDLKPANLMITDSPEGPVAKVLDFGLAAFVESADPSAQKLTETGMVVGTPNYLSPECCMGHAADERSDIYALGCILYECVAGGAPFDDPDFVRILYRHVNEHAKRIDRSAIDLPDDLELIIHKAIQKDPDERFSSMTEFADALNAVLSGQQQQVTLPALTTISSSSERKFKRLDMLSVGTVCGALACIAIIAFFTTTNSVSWQHEQDAAELSASLRNMDDAKAHYRNALRLAKSKPETIASMLGILKVTYPFDDAEARNDEVRAMSDRVRASATDEDERVEATTLAAILAVRDRNYPLVLQLLSNDPWMRLESVKDPFFRGENFRRMKRELVCGKAEAYLCSTPPQPDRAIELLRSNQKKLTFSQYYEHIPGVVLYARALQQKGEDAKARAILSLTLRNLPRRNGFDDLAALIRGALGKEAFEQVMAARAAAGESTIRPPRPPEDETRFKKRFSPIKGAYEWDAPAPAERPQFPPEKE